MGEEAAVECDEGFELKMPASGGRVICTEDGSWKSAENQNEFPVCRGMYVNHNQSLCIFFSASTSIVMSNQ